MFVVSVAACPAARTAALRPKRAVAGHRQGHPADIARHAHDHLLPTPHEDGGYSAHRGKFRCLSLIWTYIFLCFDVDVDVDCDFDVGFGGF